MKPNNIFYAQSGGPTAVINATAASLIQAARQQLELGKVYAGRHGILGALRNQLIDTDQETAASIEQLKHTPGSAFGSCRYRLRDPELDDSEYQRLLEVFRAYEIGYFFYNGGGDSQDTANKIAQYFADNDYPLTVIGLPKTIDNDLPHTDCCPGFASVAKYLAATVHGTAIDVEGMAESSTQVFILEAMGRHTGWIAASSALAQLGTTHAPHLILLPETVFDKSRFLLKVRDVVKQHGHCVIVASEGIRDQDGNLVCESAQQDAFGHRRLGGVAPLLSEWIHDELTLKNHWAVANLMQRSARFIASAVDVEHACAIGEAAIHYALDGKNHVMLTIERQSNTPYRWQVGTTPLAGVANVEKMLPPHFIRQDGFGVTPACLDYLTPLIQGEAAQPYNQGIPQYARLKNQLAQHPLPEFITHSNKPAKLDP